MFESLDERMKQDLKAESSTQQRVLLWIGVTLVSVVVFGGLYFGVQMLN